MTIIETKHVIENGIDYTINIFDNGATEKYPTQTTPPPIPPPPTMREHEVAELTKQTNIEYLVAMNKLMMGGK